MKKIAMLLALAALLAACASDSKKEKADEKPAKLVDIDAKLKVQRVWSYGLGGDAERLRLALRAAVDQGVVYAAAHSGEVAALTADAGRKVWSVKTKEPLSAGPGVGRINDIDAATIVVVGSSNGWVLALDAVTGAERWRHRLSSQVMATPVVASGRVIVRTEDGRVASLSAASGEQQWQADQAVPRLSLRGASTPVVAGGSIIAGFDNGRIVALDLATGETQWDTLLGAPSGRSELERLVDVDGPIAVIGNDVFVAGFQSRVAMLARDSGQIWWAQEFSSYRGVVANDAALYAANAEGVVVAMKRADGAVTWEQNAMRKRALTTPTVVDGMLAIGDFEGYVHWLSAADGSLLARAKTDGERITNAPVAADGFVYVQTDGGKLIAFRTVEKS